MLQVAEHSVANAVASHHVAVHELFAMATIKPTDALCLCNKVVVGRSLLGCVVLVDADDKVSHWSCLA